MTSAETSPLTLPLTPLLKPLVIYGIPNCDTVKSARAWLAEQAHAPSFHDFKKAGVPQVQLDAWIAAAGWQRVLNCKGTTWRKLDEAQRLSIIDTASAAALMQRHASLIKRPIVEWSDGSITIGFDETEWAKRLSARPIG